MTRNERARKKADDRSLRILKMWQGGQSYAALSRSLGISKERVRVIVSRGKMVQEAKIKKPLLRKAS